MVHTRDLRHEPWRYRLRAFVSTPANLLLVFFLIVLVVLSLLPMATMLSNMFTVHVGTEKKLLRLPVGSTTLWHFQKLFVGDDWSQVNFWQPLWNSLIVALGSGILGIAVGGTVAWFITRSDLKCKKFISAVFVFPYMMPAWTLALFWTNMFQNSQVGGGNIGMALEVLNGDGLEEKDREFLTDALSLQSDADVLKVSTRLKDQRETADQYLILLENALHQALLAKAGLLPEGALAQYPAAWRACLPQADEAGLNRMLDAVFLARKRRAGQVNWQSTVDQLMMTILEEQKTWRQS